MSDPTPAQHRLATAMVNDSAYPELLKGLQEELGYYEGKLAGQVAAVKAQVGIG